MTYPSIDDYLISQYEVSYLYYPSLLIDNDISDKNKDGFVGFGIEYNDSEINRIIDDYQSQVRSTRSPNMMNLNLKLTLRIFFLNYADFRYEYHG